MIEPRPSAEPVLDLRDPGFIDCPYPSYARVQASTPVFDLPGIGTGVMGYENLVGLSRDHEHFSRQVPVQMARLGVGDNPISDEVLALRREMHEEVPALFTLDPPAHTPHRRLVNQAFMPRRIRALEPKLNQLAHELIDRFAARGSVEFVAEFAVPFPLGMITDLLGVPREDMARMKVWTDDMLAGVSDILSEERRLEVTRSALEFQRYFLRMIADRRQTASDDVLGDLVGAELEDGTRLSDGELLTIIGQIGVAGHETSTNFLGNAMVILLTDAVLLRQISEDRSRIPDFVEEVLRFDPPLQCTYRRTAREAVLGGTRIAAGQTVAAFWAAAGYDETVFERPHEFRLGRANARRHLAFGHGTHFCVGSELARQEGRVALNILLDRLGRLALDEQASDLRRRESFAHHGYRSIVLRFDAG